MAYPSVTYTFTNGTTASATEVNQNFSDLISGLSAGTKDLSIAAITVAGAASFNGTVTLGNATGDDVTVTGYVASAIIPKTDDTYDLGTAALAWQDAYFDGAVYTDTISELTAAAGVVVDSLTIKDGGITGAGRFISDNTTDASSTTDGSIQTDGGLSVVKAAVIGTTLYAAGATTLGPSSGSVVSHIIQNNTANPTALVKNTSNNPVMVDFYANGSLVGELSVTTGKTMTLYTAANGVQITTAGAVTLGPDDTARSHYVRGSYANTSGSTDSPLYISSSGELFRSTSARKYKNNIEPLPYGLSEVLKISPVRYTSTCDRDDKTKRHIGIVADDVDSIIPELVQRTGGEIENFDYTRFPAVLCQAIKDLSSKLDEATARISVLEAR